MNFEDAFAAVFESDNEIEEQPVVRELPPLPEELQCAGQ